MPNPPIVRPGSAIPILRLALGVLTFLVPAASGRADAQGVSLSANELLRVTVAGAGTPVLLIPGLFGSAYGFRKLVPRLTQAGYRVIVVEPLGIGGSSKPEGADYSLTAQADRLASVLAVLGVDRAVVVAHSVGASMALRLAYRHPEQVAAVVSIEGGPAEAAATPGFRRAMTFAPLLKLFGGLRLIRGKVRGTLVNGSANPAWVTDEVVAGYMAAGSVDLGATLTAFRGMARAREPQELHPYLSQVRCPVHLLLGAVPHEGGPSATEIELLRDRLPSFALESVPGAGHFIFEEDPAAVVAAVDRTLGSSRSARKASAR